MKNIHKIIALSIVGLASGLNACKEPFDLTPVPATSPSSYTANFVFVNAVPDASSLDFYINNLMVGSSLDAQTGQTAYTTVPITSNGVFANTNIRAKATTGTIGGVLNKADLIYRATNISTNNFQASANGNYTVIALDTLNRPAPVRTLNSGNFGDATYYSTISSFTAPAKVGGGDTTIQLSSNNSIVTYNLVKKYNNNVAPSFLISIGTVPLGSSDVGGPRYLLLTDALVTPVTGKFAVRFVNLSPDAGAVTCKVNAVSVAANSAYPMLLSSTFTPAVGSRSLSVAFTNNFTVAGTYDIVVTGTGLTVTDAGYVFADGGDYSIFLSGDKKSGYGIIVVKNK